MLSRNEENLVLEFTQFKFKKGRNFYFLGNYNKAIAMTNFMMHMNNFYKMNFTCAYVVMLSWRSFNLAIDVHSSNWNDLVGAFTG